MPESDIQPGFMVLQGNRLEDLRQVTLEWLARHPLDPLEDEVLLVQSNGIAQWLKMTMAADQDGWGIAFGVRALLPARMQWEAYRAVLEAAGSGVRLPQTSPYDKAQLRWRLMRLIPQRAGDATFAPLEHFLGDDPDQRKRFQLAERLADLFDQYQVYRADWLEAWSAFDDVQIDPQGLRSPLPEDQRWQPALWRDIEASLPEHARQTHRAAIHQAFMAAASRLDAESRPEALPRRLVVFGISALPRQTLEALHALSGAMQIMLCMVNPCRHYWGDAIEHRELLTAEYRRQQRKPGLPAVVDDVDLHLHTHPLLAAWGKQGRDYLHLLDAHDETERYAERFRGHGLRIDLFEEPPTDSLLGQLQNDVLDLRPLDETRSTWPAVDARLDQSVVFHVAHSPQRELEILHDQLLAAFAADATLRPRDIIVMVPEVNTFSASIHAVFGQFDADDRRHVPYQVADRRQRHFDPLLVALEQLLSLPRLRFRASEILGLLDVPAVRERFGLAEGDLPVLERWIEGANIRWGLHGEQRAALDLPDDDLHTFRFGLERMLLGYAVGAGAVGAGAVGAGAVGAGAVGAGAVGAPDTSSIATANWSGIVPFGEVAGLDAALVGPLFRLLEALDRHRLALEQPRAPEDWGRQLQVLLDDFFRSTSSHDDQLLGTLRDTLDAWLEECTAAEFDDPVPLTLVRDTWLARLDEPNLSQRFLGGAVTFATLMPMRAIPFRRICLLGMNDGDYPRQTTRMDFDLMAVRGQYRPGDRSRREDDRYLFLEAILSAREALYVSWCGRSLRDNSEQPPSVLVGQLRDHLAAGWALAQPSAEGSGDGDALLSALTTLHPLQPFSRDYFRAADPAAGDTAGAISRARLITYAREWQQRPVAGGAAAADILLPLWIPEADLTLQRLADFLRNPMEQLYRLRLETAFGHDELTSADEEPFAFDGGLDRWQQQDAVLQPAGRRLASDPDLDPASIVDAIRTQRLKAGHYPAARFGDLTSLALTEQLSDALTRYRDRLQAFPEAVDPLPEVNLAATLPVIEPATGRAHAVTLTLADSIDAVRSNGVERCRLVLTTSNLHLGRQLRWSVIVRHWPAHLALQLSCPNTPTHLIGPTDDQTLQGLDAGTARGILLELMQAWIDGMQTLVPTTAELGFIVLDQRPTADDVPRDIGALAKALERPFGQEHARGGALARSFATSADMAAHPDFVAAAERLYRPLHAQRASARETPA